MEINFHRICASYVLSAEVLKVYVKTREALSSPRACSPTHAYNRAAKPIPEISGLESSERREARVSATVPGILGRSGFRGVTAAAPFSQTWARLLLWKNRAITGVPVSSSRTPRCLNGLISVMRPGEKPPLSDSGGFPQKAPRTFSPPPNCASAISPEARRTKREVT